MKIQIKHRFTDTVLFEGEATTVKVAIQKAVESGADLRGANLRGADLRDADLSGANLRGANLRGADLRDADLRGANLRGADLRDADLRDADLSGANLRGANLRDADLRGANLRGADLRDADLSGADLRGADLRDADLSGANGLQSPKSDLWAVLLSAPKEATGLLAALREGRVNGSVYSGECACLVGTIANLRHCDVQQLPESILPNANRPSERWFLAIRIGDTPENSSIVKLTVEWIEEWQKYFDAAVQIVTAKEVSA